MEWKLEWRECVCAGVGLRVGSGVGSGEEVSGGVCRLR